MSDIKRIDPRAPFTVPPDGIKRIERRDRSSDAAAIEPKPLRELQSTEQWFMAIAHTNRGSLDDPARQAIAAAAILATPNTGVVAVILGELTDDAGSCGADRVVVLPDFEAARFQPGREVAEVTALIDAYDAKHVFIPDTADAGGDLGRRLIVAYSASSATHVVEIDAAHVSIPWSGGTGLAQAALPRFVLLEPGAIDADLPFVGAGGRVNPPNLLAAAAPHTACRDLGLEDVDASQMPLEEADFIVSGGNGVRNVETLEALAHALGASVGASRVAIDDGRFARDKQVGATGKTVTANTYIAVGISGAVQHLQGIKDCRHVIAINRDAGAPIVKRADLTVIADAEELMQALLTELTGARARTKTTEAA